MPTFAKKKSLAMISVDFATILVVFGRFWGISVDFGGFRGISVDFGGFGGISADFVEKKGFADLAPSALAGNFQGE